MSEIRLTFDANDFGAISQVLIDMGIGFRVEPAKGPAPDPVQIARLPTSQQRKPARKVSKATTSPRKSGARPSVRSAPVSLAERLREATTRNPPVVDAASTESPEDE